MNNGQSGQQAEIDGFDADNLDYGDDVTNDTELNRSVRKNETKENKSKDYVSYTITSDKELKIDVKQEILKIIPTFKGEITQKEASKGSSGKTSFTFDIETKDEAELK